MTAGPAPLCFAHATYRIGEEYRTRDGWRPFVEARSVDELDAAIGDAEILCVSGLWRSHHLELARKLRLIQATSAGVDQFDVSALHRRGIRLCSARGVNAPAVAEHAMALMLGIVRQLPAARDRQQQASWRGMVSDRMLREGELSGRTLLIIGLGTIGRRLATLARAFGMQVIGVARQPEAADGVRVVAFADMDAAIGSADMVCLTCSLNESTRGLVDGAFLRRMKPSAWLLNLSRGQVVVEQDLTTALEEGLIAGAALDCFEVEPLPASSPLWRMENVVITPHSAGETSLLEPRFVDLLIENMRRLQSGRSLVNEIHAARADPLDPTF